MSVGVPSILIKVYASPDPSTPDVEFMVFKHQFAGSPDSTKDRGVHAKTLETGRERLQISIEGQT